MFRLRIWGIRGSLASPLSPVVLQERLYSRMKEFFEFGYSDATQIQEYMRSIPDYKMSGFGGNTSCFEVFTEKTQLIVDAGTGIRELGLQVQTGLTPTGLTKAGALGTESRVYHILLTHFHRDHLIGLPFFSPIFLQNNQVHLYAVQPELEEVIRNLFQKPLFPVSFEKLKSEVIFHQLQPRVPSTIGDIEVTPYQLDHPDPCWGYRMQSQGRVYAHCVDTECIRVSKKDLGPDLPLYTDVDLMVFDAQYSLHESTQKINWGHAAATIGLDIAMREGIKKVLFVHHDPAESDFQIHRGREQTREYYDTALLRAKKSGHRRHEVEWEFAREGTEIDI